eukprot:403335654
MRDQNGDYQDENTQQQYREIGRSGNKMLLVNNANTGNAYRSQQTSQLVNLNINNSGKQRFQQQNLQNGNQMEHYQRKPQISYNSKNQGIRTLRPQSAKPAKDRYQIVPGASQESSTIYGQNFQIVKNQTVGHDMSRYNQIKSKLNTKLGTPYIDSIKAASQRQDYGIVTYQPKQMNRLRPMSGKPIQKSPSNFAHQNLSSDSQANPQIIRQNKNRSLTRRPSNDNQTSIYVNLNLNLDKEQLYQASITLKAQLNLSLNENQQLRTQIQFLNKEMGNREKMLNEIIQTGKLQNKTNDNTLLSFKLKQQLREVQNLMKTKDAEIELLKRNIRSTRLEEAEHTVQVFMQEGVRLRQQLQQALSMSLNFHQQSSPNHMSQNDTMNEQLKARLLDMNKMIEQLQITLQGKEKEILIWKQRCEKDINKQAESQNKFQQKGKDSQMIAKEEHEFVKQKVNDLQYQYDQVLIENQQLQDSNQVYKGQIENLKQEKEQLQQHDSADKMQIDKLTKENKVLQEKKLSLEQELNQQKKLNENLKVQHQLELEKLKTELQDQIKNDIYDEDEIQTLKQQIQTLKEQHQIQLKDFKEGLQKKYILDLEKQKSDLELLHMQNLQKQINSIVKENEQAIKDLKFQQRQELQKLQREILQLKDQLKISEEKLVRTSQQLSESEQILKSRQSQIINQYSNQTPSIQNKTNRSSQQSISQSNNLEKRTVIKEEQIKHFYDQMKIRLQLEKVQKEHLSNFLFSDNLENREDISIKDFADVLYIKFQLSQNDSLNLSRFIIEQPDISQRETQYDPNKTLMNRKIIKFMNEKVLGQQYQFYSADQERHVIIKFRELAVNHFNNLESTLTMYDDEDKGLITINDLKEGLSSFDIYDGKDKTSFECLVLYILNQNHKDTKFIKISDVLGTLFPDRETQIMKSSTISKRLSQSNTVNRSQTSQIQNQKSTVRFDSQQSLRNQATLIQKSHHEIQEDFDDNYQSEVLERNLTLIKSMNEEELLQKSENAFQMITQHLQSKNLSLRNLLKEHIYDKKIAIIQQNQNPDIEQSDPNYQPNQIKPNSQRSAFDQTFEVINVEDFFNKLQIHELSKPLQDSVIQIAAKPLKTEQYVRASQENKGQMIFIYKDLEEILGAYGFEDQSKPRNSRNMKYDMLDQKSIRVMNRLAEYLRVNTNVTFRDLVGDKIYRKTINNSQLGASSKKLFKLEFIKTKDFFEVIKDLRLRKSSEQIKNLVEFLSIDSKVYKSGIVVKKIEKLLKECSENEFIKSIGGHKKRRESLQMKATLRKEDSIIEEQYEEQFVDDINEDIGMSQKSSKIDLHSLKQNLNEENEKIFTRNVERSPLAPRESDLQIVQTHQNHNSRHPIVEEEKQSSRSPPLLQLSINQPGQVQTLSNNLSSHQISTSHHTKRSLQSSAQPNQKSRGAVNKNLHHFSSGQTLQTQYASSSNITLQNQNISVQHKTSSENTQVQQSKPYILGQSSSNNHLVKQEQTVKHDIKMYLKFKNQTRKPSQDQDIDHKGISSKLKALSNPNVLKSQHSSSNLHKNQNRNALDEEGSQIINVNQNQIQIKETNQTCEYDGIFLESSSTQTLYQNAIKPEIVKFMRSQQNLFTRNMRENDENYDALKKVEPINQMTLMIVGDQNQGKRELLIGQSMEQNQINYLYVDKSELEKSRLKQPSKIFGHSASIHQKINSQKEYKSKQGLLDFIANELRNNLGENCVILISLMKVQEENNCLIDCLSENENVEIETIGSQILRNQYFKLTNKESIQTFNNVLRSQLSSCSLIIQLKIINQKFQNDAVINIGVLNNYQFENLFQYESQNQLNALFKKSFHGFYPLTIIQCLDGSGKDQHVAQKCIQSAQKLEQLRIQLSRQTQEFQVLDESVILKQLPQSLLQPIILQDLSHLLKDKLELMPQSEKSRKNMKQFSSFEGTINYNTQTQKLHSYSTQQSKVMTGSQSTTNKERECQNQVLLQQKSSKLLNNQQIKPQVSQIAKMKHQVQNLQKNFSQSNFQSKRMTTINEQLKEDAQDYTTLQTNPNLNEEFENGEQNYKNINDYLQRGRQSKNQIQRNLNNQEERSSSLISSDIGSDLLTPSNYNKNSSKILQNDFSMLSIGKNQARKEQQINRELEIFQKLKQEYQLNEELLACENEIKLLKADIHKNSKKLTQKNLRTNIDDLKSELKLKEATFKKLEKQLQGVIKSKEVLQNQANQSSSFTSRDHSSMEEDKDRKLKEMEVIIQEMQKKLQEKDKIIAETNNRQVNKIQQIQTINTQKYSDYGKFSKPDQALSPTFSQRHLGQKSQQSILNKQQSCAILSTQAIKVNHQNQNQLTESQSQSILSQKEDSKVQTQKQTKVLPDRRKNNSTANLFKWQKPIVQIKIGTNDENQSSMFNSNSSKINSIKNSVAQVQQNKPTQKMETQLKIGLENNQQHFSSSSFNSLSLKANNLQRNKSQLDSFKPESSTDSNYLTKKISSNNLEQPEIKKIQEKNTMNLFQLNDDVDEGVQNLKKSIIPIRCINNLMGGSSKNIRSSDYSFDSSSSRLRKSTNQSIQFTGNNSNLKSDRQYKFKDIINQNSHKLQKTGVIVNDRNFKIENPGSKESSKKIINQKNKLKKAMTENSEGTMRGQSYNNKQNPIQSKIKISEDDENVQIPSQNDITQNSIINDENMENTPPKLKEKISQFASKNKFFNAKPKTIDLSIKGHLIINQGAGKNTQHSVLKSQEVNLIEVKQDNVIHRQRANSQLRETSLSIAGRRERLDSFMRKSFELMTTLRESADQVSNLKPINRAAIRQQSQERSGIMSTKNLQTQENYLSNQMCGSFNSQLGAQTNSECQRRTILFGYQKSPLNNNPIYICRNTNEKANNDSILDQSRTLDNNRSVTSIQNLNNLVEKSLSCLKNYNSSNPNFQQNSNLKEQILVRCMNNGSQQSVNQSQQLTSTQLRWMNRTLLSKCKSNESLQQVNSIDIQKEALTERPRSITLAKQSPTILKPILESKDTPLDVSKKIPKWGELAQIIKNNFSPSSSQIMQNTNHSINNQNSQDDKLNINNSNHKNSFQKQYFIKHNRIDLSQSMTGLQGLQKPPTNPNPASTSVRRKRFANFENQNDESQVLLGNQNMSLVNQDQSQMINCQQPNQNVRLRSESQYLPGVLKSFEGKLKFSENLEIQSPSVIENAKYDLHNTSYQQRRLLQQQSHAILSTSQTFFSSKQNNQGTFGLQRILQERDLNINLNTNSTSSLDRPVNTYGLGLSSGYYSAVNKPINQNLHQISSSADFRAGFFTNLASPQFGLNEPIGRKDKAKPEVTELIEKQRSRINSQNKRTGIPILESLNNYNSNGILNKGNLAEFI